MSACVIVCGVCMCVRVLVSENKNCSTAALALPACDSASAADVNIFTVGLFYRRLKNNNTQLEVLFKLLVCFLTHKN